MEKSDSIKEIAMALCKFQREVGKIKKETDNPFFKSKYASLANILDVISEPLANNGLSFVQFPVADAGLTTVLMHVSGEYIAETYFMKPVKSDPQSLGSVITYQRRYALGAVLGLNIDIDDDANAASGLSRREPTPEELIHKKRPFPAGYLSDERQMDRIMTRLAQRERETGGSFDPAACLEQAFIIQPEVVSQIISMYNSTKTA